MNYIDLRSDTVTWPTENMRKAMAEALVGDDVWGDDPTVQELESYAAKLVGKEAALFMPSGTMSNQLALFTHCKRGQEVILDDDCHIVQHEAGGSAIIAGVQLRTVEEMISSQFEKKIRKNIDIHEPTTGLICLENARSCGKLLSLEFMQEVKKIADKYKLPIHLDGARLFNAATALNVDAKEIAKNVDSLMFCLSKGLCAPIGSMLCGTKEFIENARAKRKILGGGMRQVGILASAGLLAIKEQVPLLENDHKNARYMAEELAKLDFIEINPNNVEINMVFFNFKNTKVDGFVEFLLENGIKVGDIDSTYGMRFVLHHWITKENIDFVIEKFIEFFKS